jgi:hypothetical protein
VGEKGCVPTQVNALRHYNISRLEELSTSTADRLLARLMEFGRQTPRRAG